MKKQSEGAEMKPKEMGRAKTIMLHLIPETIILTVAVGLLYGFKMYLA